MYIYKSIASTFKITYLYNNNLYSYKKKTTEITQPLPSTFCCYCIFFLHTIDPVILYKRAFLL